MYLHQIELEQRTRIHMYNISMYLTKLLLRSNQEFEVLVVRSKRRFTDPNRTSLKKWLIGTKQYFRAPFERKWNIHKI